MTTIYTLQGRRTDIFDQNGPGSGADEGIIVGTSDATLELALPASITSISYSVLPNTDDFGTEIEFEGGLESFLTLDGTTVEDLLADPGIDELIVTFDQINWSGGTTYLLSFFFAAFETNGNFDEIEFDFVFGDEIPFDILTDEGVFDFAVSEFGQAVANDEDLRDAAFAGIVSAPTGPLAPGNILLTAIPWDDIEVVATPTPGPDILSGTPGGEEIDGLAGNDLINGLGGDDTLIGGDGNDIINGGAGDDSISGGNNFDTISAGEGNDTVAGDNGRDLVFLNQGDDLYIDNAQGGELGRDTVFTGFGNDTVEGGNGDDVFYGEDGNDVINGRLGNDLIFGGNQFDTISAGEGNDTVFGGNGRDLVFLNQGDDLFNDNGQGGELGRDTVFTGLGNDTVQGGNGDDQYFGEAGNDVIFGRLGNDSIYGGDNFDFIDAGDGNDLVFGGNGQDTVILGAGDDTFIDTNQGGDLGRDTITGGTGADTFAFGATISTEVITDFEVGVDALELNAGLTGGRSAAQVAADGVVTGNGVLLGFGAGQSILLEGLTSTVGLGDDIGIV